MPDPANAAPETAVGLSKTLKKAHFDHSQAENGWKDDW
jgi:hypothetical protein